jgi:cobaltochelatase CobS
MSNFESAMAQALGPTVAKSIRLADLSGAEEFVRDLIRKQSTTIEVKFNDKDERIRIENCHHKFEEVLKHLQTMEPVFLTGPAGSGKSTIGEHAAMALKLDFASISVCAQTTKSDLLGYKDANGNYVETMFRRIYENGGIFLIDEIDAGNANVLAVLNAALSGSQYAFPDKSVKKNEKFLVIATANTLGKGSNEYIGRNQLDAATLDRFNFIHIDYDTKLEKILVGHGNAEYLKKMHKIRKFIIESNMKIIVSTRSIVKVIKLMKVGFSFKESIKTTIFKTTHDADFEVILKNSGALQSGS